ncbi:MAG: hypothetical protein IJT69_05160, partial [Clostridia bacterium]|nr:hypothetical protein [Clostridia bacterium]
MKRKLVTLLCFALILAFALCLVACNKTGGQLPTDKYEKVAFAFSGVARSLSGHGDAALSASAQTFYGTVAHADEYDGTEAVRTLYSLFDMREQTDDPDFKYDEPPMIQFQYIKALYDEVGKDYEFGKIYTGTVTGHADFDFATGEKTVRQDYTSEARIDIDIDENDLITVHLGLQTVYTHGSESHEQRFYAELYLDYDMTKTEPNYELTMKYVDDCSRFVSESERTNTYEYDFVNVKQGAISEWRKLYHCSPTRLVRDAEHTSFASYADAVLYGGRAHAYKDGVKYATNHTDVHGHSVNYALRRSISTLFFDSFG